MHHIPGLRTIEDPIDVDALNDNIRFIAEAIASVEHRLMALVTEVDHLRAMIAAPTMAVPSIADRTIPVPTAPR